MNMIRRLYLKNVASKAYSGGLASASKAQERAVISHFRQAAIDQVPFSEAWEDWLERFNDTAMDDDDFADAEEEIEEVDGDEDEDEYESPDDAADPDGEPEASEEDDEDPDGEPGVD